MKTALHFHLYENVSLKSLNNVLSIYLAVLCCAFSSCKKNIDINLGSNEPHLIVEAYINNLMPEFNYVLLTRSINYFDDQFMGVGVTDAQVAITEGELLANGSIAWNNSNKIQLEQSADGRIPDDYRKGFYVDQKTIETLSNGGTGFSAEPGKYYLLEISWEGRNYHAVTSLPSLVKLDSLSTGSPIADQEDAGKLKAPVTAHYKDPDTIGNRQLYYWKYSKNRDSYGWGGLSSNRYSNGEDDLVNGQSVRMTQPASFADGELVDYYLVSVTRPVYEFWESFNNARNNAGPFSTPIKLKGNVQGPGVTGCFSGFTVSTKSIVVKL